MLFLYNVLQFLILFFFWPLLLAAVILHPKYRASIPRRLGWRLQDTIRTPASEKKTIWIHALSVGEVTSALPLVHGIRSTMDVHLVFSVTTRTGGALAEKMIAPHVDRLIPFPLDILWVAARFLRTIRPDLFILVETDFWPNLLALLEDHRIPALLVNGRISEKSRDSYRRFRFFFRPLFSSFAALCMQTAAGRRSMIDLGVPEERIFSLGNLKYDLAPLLGKAPEGVAGPADMRILAGSTHRGEEEILLPVFKDLQKLHNHLSFVIAPRDITRGKEIQQLADSLGFTASRRSEGIPSPLPELFILDTIGELAGYYHICSISFVGGSLVEEGGHNPIEPACAGVPILFGPHMEDFSEIAEDLLASGAAVRIHDAGSLLQSLEDLVSHPALRERRGAAAISWSKAKQGVIHRHLELIRKFL